MLWFLICLILAISTTLFVKRLGKYSSKYFSIISLVDQSDGLFSKKMGLVLLFAPSLIVFISIYLLTKNVNYAFTYLILTLCFTFYPAIVYPEVLLQGKYYKHKNLIFMLFLLYSLLDFALCSIFLKLINAIDILKINNIMKFIIGEYANVSAIIRELVLSPLAGIIYAFGINKIHQKIR